MKGYMYRTLFQDSQGDQGTLSKMRMQMQNKCWELVIDLIYESRG